MPERGFTTETWDEDWFQDFSITQRYLYLYLKYNGHCNPAGVYHVTLATISFEAKLDRDSLPELIQSLAPRIEWYPQQNYIWVKDFIKSQSKSPKFLIAVGKALRGIQNNSLVEEVIQYNLNNYSISIPYEYSSNTVSIPSDRVSIPSSAATATSTSAISNKEKGVVKGGEELAAITKVYEENIGVITPMVAERLKDIAERYPPGWFKDAVDEAVGANARNLLYTEKILDRWEREGYKAPRQKGGPHADRRGSQQTKAAGTHQQDIGEGDRFSGFHAIESGPDEPGGGDED